MTWRKSKRKGRWGRSHHSVLVVGLLVFILGCPAADDRVAETGAQAAASGGGEAARDAGAAVVRPPAGHAWVVFDADTVVAEIAATADQRAQGLMYREELPDGTGMLFVFQDNAVRAFWMANTYLPLDIAYMDPSYRIIDIVAMEPLVTDTYPSSGPAMFALEVRQGWFEEQGIRVGDQAEIMFGIGGGR